MPIIISEWGFSVEIGGSRARINLSRLNAETNIELFDGEVGNDFCEMPREQERTTVSLGTILEWSSGKRQARVSDLSLGGCFVDCIANLREGEIVSFKISVADEQWLELGGEVVYALPGFGFGVRFSELSGNQMVLLEHLILMNNGNPWGGGEKITERETEVHSPPFAGRVLLSDDDPEIQDFSRDILQREGYEIVSVKDTREAYYQMLSDADFAAVLFDAELPELKAFNVIRYMKMEKRLQNIPVGILTERDDQKLRRYSLAAGAGIFLPKPFTPEQMNHNLKMLIGGSLS